MIREFDNSLSEDEIANVKVLRRHRTCRGQSLRPLTSMVICAVHQIIYAPTPIKPNYQSLFCLSNR